MATLSPAPKAQFFDANGVPLSGGKLYTYAAGTTTPQVSYTSSSGLTANTNPVILDSRGEANVWLGDNPYKLVLKDSTDVEIWSVDNIYRTATVADVEDILPVLAEPGGSALIGFVQAGTSAVATTVQTKLREAISITDFGASPSAAAAVNSAAITAAINALPDTGGKLYIPYGTYLIKGQQHIFSSKTNFLIEGNNATLRVADAEPVTGGIDIFYFTSCTDGIVQNITLDGNRANRVPAEVQANCFTIWSFCARLKFINCNGVNSVNDGFYIVAANADKANQAAYPTDITFLNCTAKNAYRNGLSSICSLRLTIQGGSYSGSNGTNPKAGIGFEPDAGYTYANQYVTVTDVNLYDNDGYGMYCGGPINNKYIAWRDIRGNNNAGGLIQIMGATGVVLDGVYVGPHTTLARGAIDIQSATRVQVLNVYMEDISDSTSAYGIYVQSDVGDIQISNVQARNLSCPIIYTNAGITIQNVSGISLSNKGIILAFGTRSIVQNASFNTITQEAIYVDASINVILENINIVNCTSTTACIFFSSSALYPTIRGVDIYQPNAIPGGSYGIYYACTPYYIDNVTARAGAGLTQYSYQNIFYFAAGFSYTNPYRTWLTNCRPSPLTGAPDIGPVTVNAGATTTATYTFANTAVATGAIIAATDALIVAPFVDLSGLVLTAAVSASNTVRYTLYNPTGSPITLAQNTWLFVVEKKPS